MNEEAPRPASEPSEVDVNAGTCLHCGGVAGHHFMDCNAPKEATVSDAIEEARPEEGNGEFDEQKLPPTDEDLASNEMLWLVAKTCYEVNRQFCAGVSGDYSHPPWEEAPEIIRQGTYDGVVHYFHNPGRTPEQMHEEWMRYKLEQGWRYGNAKDIGNKIHPNLVPFHQLHVHERTKDAMFVAICRTMLGDEET